MPSRKIKSDDQSFELESESDESAAGNYSVISYKDRIRLIQMVCLEKQQILHTASLLRIKISTAKYILRCFRKEGKVLKKNYDLQEQQMQFHEEIRILKQKIDQMNKNRRRKKTKSTKTLQKPPTCEQTQQQKKGDSNSEKVDLKPDFTSAKLEQVSQLNPTQVNPNIVYYWFYNPSLMTWNSN